MDLPTLRKVRGWNLCVICLALFVRSWRRQLAAVIWRLCYIQLMSYIQCVMVWCFFYLLHIYIYIYFLTCPHIATLYCELRSWVVCTPNIKVNPCALVFFYLALCLVWCFQLRHIYIYSSFWRRCLINSSCDSEFHIHGVICMIVRHKENVLGSATYSDFYVSC